MLPFILYENPIPPLPKGRGGIGGVE